MEKIKIIIWKTIGMVVYPGYWWGTIMPIATRSRSYSSFIRSYASHDVREIFSLINKKKSWLLNPIYSMYNNSQEDICFGYSTYNQGGVFWFMHKIVFLVWWLIHWIIKLCVVYVIKEIGLNAFFSHPIGCLIAILVLSNWISLMFGVRFKYEIIKTHKEYFTQKNMNYLKAQVSGVFLLCGKGL